MKKLLLLALCLYSNILIGSNPLEATASKTDQVIVVEETSSHSKTLAQILYGTVAVGGFISLLIWSPQTFNVLKNHGVEAAINSTLLPRVILDGLTITAGVHGYTHANDAEEKEAKPVRALVSETAK